jgi:UDP-N-acetylglucosamine acyltransferase
MAGHIHPTALVDPAAEIDSSVVVGPYSIIGPQVRIDAGTEVGAHCVIDGVTTIGRNNQFYRYCSIGGIAQDKKYYGELARLTIGDGNTVREFTTFNAGTAQGGGGTTVGNNNWVMAYAHIAHDCVVGDHTVLANAVQLGGHVTVGDWAILGGLSAVHQFSRVGMHSMAGGGSIVTQDILPYGLVAGNPCRPVGINVEGLKRRGFFTPVIAVLREAYKVIYRRGLKLEEACDELRKRQEAQPETREALQVILDFLKLSRRGIVRP